MFISEERIKYFDNRIWKLECDISSIKFILKTEGMDLTGEPKSRALDDIKDYLGIEYTPAVVKPAKLVKIKK